MSASPSNASAMADILLSLGGNLGDPAAAIAAALDALEAEGIAITARSRFYRTPPWGRTDQPDFVNLCAGGRTELSPRALLQAILRVERQLGRKRESRWGPRRIDIDILTYDALVIREPDLTLPHPHLTERGFVLVPLLDIAPDVIIAGETVSHWAAAADRTGIEAIDRAASDGDLGPRVKD